jgi:hypothetical protein
MKTYAISILAIFAALALSACGGSKDQSASSDINSVIDPDQQVNLSTRPQLSDYASDPSVAAPYTCGNGGVTICHFPPGNPNNRHSLCIGEPAVAHHIKEHQRDNIGDYLGSCEGDGDGTGTTGGTTGGTDGGTDGSTGGSTGDGSGSGGQIIDCTDPANSANPLCA